MRRTHVLALSLALCFWSTSAQADTAPRPPCLWEFAEDAELRARAGSLISLEAMVVDMECFSEVEDLSITIEDEEGLAWEADWRLYHEPTRVVALPRTRLEPGAYTLRVEYRSRMGEMEERAYPLTLEPGLEISVTTFDPQVGLEDQERCCADDSMCVSWCEASSSSSVIEADFDFGEVTSRVWILLQGVSQPRSVDAIPSRLDLLDKVWTLSEPIDTRREEVALRVPGSWAPCARLIAQDIETSEVLGLSGWVCAENLNQEAGCERAELVCEVPDGGGARPGMVAGEGPGMVTARPSGGCGGCVTAPGGRGSSSLALLGLLMWGVGRGRRRWAASMDLK